MDKFLIVSEIFNTIHHEKVLDKFPILNLSIYKHHKLVTKRYLTARLVITDHKLVIDRLSSINPLPVLIDPKGKISDYLEMWEPHRAFDIEYRFIHHIEFDKDINSLVIYTLINRAIVIMKFMNNEQTSKKIIDIVNKFIQ